MNAPPSPEPILTVANQLTLLRMFLAPVIVILVFSREVPWALGLFVVASLTDFLDGLVARLGHQATRLGAVLDPIADKLLISGLYVALAWGPDLVNPMPRWLTAVVLSRDVILLVSTAAVSLTLGPRPFLPSALGKACTVVQLLTAAVVLAANAGHGPMPLLSLLHVATLLFTVASALHYLYRASTGTPAS